jgi:colanic acid biosynthesis glycosyl transferase WcaI
MIRCLEQKGVAPDRLVEFRNWVDTGIIVAGLRDTRLRVDLGMRRSDIVALYSGAMSHKQGLELIIEAARTTRASHPSLQYVLCGNGPIRDKLTRMADGLDNVRFLDLQPAERVPELLATADFHLLPQKSQVADLVLPSKLAGMLASGRPVIAMADPGTGIALETEAAGLVIPPGDARALAAAAIALAEDDLLRRRLGATARLRAEQRWDRVAIIRALEREMWAVPQSKDVAAPAGPPAPRPTRAIKQVSTGTRRRPEFAPHGSPTMPAKAPAPRMSPQE